VLMRHQVQGSRRGFRQKSQLSLRLGRGPGLEPELGSQRSLRRKLQLNLRLEPGPGLEPEQLVVQPVARRRSHQRYQ
jgi:hypothetical protein